MSSCNIYAEYSRNPQEVISESLNINYGIEVITFMSGETKIYIKNVSVSKTKSCTECDRSIEDLCKDGIIRITYNKVETPRLNWCIKDVRVIDLPEGSVITYARKEECERAEHPCLEPTPQPNRFFTDIREKENLVIYGDHRERRNGKYIQNPKSYAFEITNSNGWVITVLSLDKVDIIEGISEPYKSISYRISEDTKSLIRSKEKSITMFDTYNNITDFEVIVQNIINSIPENEFFTCQ